MCEKIEYMFLELIYLENIKRYLICKDLPDIWLAGNIYGYLAIIQDLLDINFQLSMRPHIGTAWLNDDYYDFHLKFFKDWTKQHLN